MARTYRLMFFAYPRATKMISERNERCSSLMYLFLVPSRIDSEIQGIERERDHSAGIIAQSPRLPITLRYGAQLSRKPRFNAFQVGTDLSEWVMNGYNEQGYGVGRFPWMLRILNIPIDIAGMREEPICRCRYSL